MITEPPDPMYKAVDKSWQANDAAMYWSDKRSHGRKSQRILSPVICIDDFGDEVYRCHITKRTTSVSESRLVGSFNVAVAGAYVCANDSKAEERLSRANWDECEANCNTCQSLKRLPKTSQTDGFMNGECLAQDGKPIRFHPDDPMHMQCWSAR